MSPIALFSPPAGEPRTINGGRFALVGLGTVVAAVIADVLVSFIGSALVGEPT